MALARIPDFRRGDHHAPRFGGQHGVEVGIPISQIQPRRRHPIRFVNLPPAAMRHRRAHSVRRARRRITECVRCQCCFHPPVLSVPRSSLTTALRPRMAGADGGVRNWPGPDDTNAVTTLWRVSPIVEAQGCRRRP